jgi:diguanylate cyclase (GGDEF)-like protein
MKPINKEPHSLRAIVSGIGLLVAITTAVAVPAGYVYVGHSAAANSLAFKAHLKANRVAKYIYNHGELWQYQSVRLAELIEVPEANSRGDQQRILDDAGKLVVELGNPPVRPAMMQSAPIVVRGVTVGHVEVASSAQLLMMHASIVAALSCLLGFGMYLAVRVLPLRVLDRTLGALENTQHNLQAHNSRFDAALNNMSQGLVMFDASERLVVCNRQYIKMYDLSPDVVQPGCTLLALIEHRAQRGHLIRDPARYRLDLLAGLSLRQREAYVVETADGREIAITDQPMANGGWVSTHEDITERRKADAKISHMALHDALTNLPNRLFFREQMEHRLAHLARDQQFAIFCLDLDGFKRVNDTLGHPIGDKLLREVADRMSGCLGEGDTMARLGGDEFAILQGSVRQPGDAIALAARLFEVVSAPFDLDGVQVIVGVSIGIAIAPTDAADPDQLLKKADLALYRAKTDGRGIYRFFEPQMDALMQARHAMEVDLRKALLNGEFELHYQPLVNLDTQAISGFEALVRWNHPQRGRVPPMDFIPLAEETALILPIGEWVLRQACSDAVKWPSHIRVAVNLSPAQFKMHNLPLMVMGVLAKSGLPAHRLELEITEAVLLVDNASTLDVLHQLRSAGIRISMDDFGTGYSSLSYLRSFPFDKIKIDRSFVHDLASNVDSKAIIRAVAGLGSDLGMATTGEGVETQEELDYLRAEGCTEAQGYFLGRPKPASDVLQLLAEQLETAKAVA